MRVFVSTHRNLRASREIGVMTPAMSDRFGKRLFVAGIAYSLLDHWREQRDQQNDDHDYNEEEQKCLPLLFLELHAVLLMDYGLKDRINRSLL